MRTAAEKQIQRVLNNNPRSPEEWSCLVAGYQEMQSRIGELEAQNHQLLRDKRVVTYDPNKKLPSNIRLPRFAGTRKGDVKSWLAQINMIYTAAQLPEPERFLYTIPLLDVLAATWFTQKFKAGEYMGWVGFEDHITHRFSHSHNSLLVRDQLYELRQEGSVFVYIEQFQMLMSRVDDMEVVG